MEEIMKLFREYVENKEINGFFSKLFTVRDQAHKLHLSTKSYAQHKALNGFYEGLLDLIDQMIETYQGEYDLVKISFTNNDQSEDTIPFIKGFADEVKNARKYFDKDTHIQNIMDEILSLTYQTLYKLRFLK
jgi:hypothetical protein